MRSKSLTDSKSVDLARSWGSLTRHRFRKAGNSGDLQSFKGHQGVENWKWWAQSEWENRLLTSALVDLIPEAVSAGPWSSIASGAFRDAADSSQPVQWELYLKRKEELTQYFFYWKIEGSTFILNIGVSLVEEVEVNKPISFRHPQDRMTHRN